MTHTLPPEEGTLSESAVQTYRYLRVAVVGQALFLGVSLAVEKLWGDSPALGSISAYYYTPVQSVFVGSLMATGLALVAIKGRAGAEDIMLNLAGMLALVVALVPTPLSEACLAGKTQCLPAGLVPNVQNNVTALLVIGVVVLVFAWRTLLGKAKRTRADEWGFVAAVAVWVAFTAWFTLLPDSFRDYAHYTSAIPFFALIAAVAVLNARGVRDRPGLRRLANKHFSRSYGVIAGAMALTISVATVVGIALKTGASAPFASWLFVVESILMVLFAAFWVLQTAENWDEGLPAEAA